MYSYSKISIFKNCQMRYKFQYVDKIKKDTSNIFTRRGSEIHSLMENFVLYLNGNKNLKNELKYQVEKTGIKNFKKFAEEFMKEFKDFEKITEKRISLNIDDSSIIGFIDLILKKDNKIILVDYKTGKSYDFKQLELYSVWAFKKYPEIEEVELMFIMIDDDYKRIKKIIKRSEMLDIINYYKKQIKEIEDVTENESFVIDKTMKYCNYCPYNEECNPEEKVGLDITKSLF